ncbi:hypothetical protein PR003_g28548 [Phytophthora rubi]|uniref:Uncharacterized protein n=1 Tax=Phytophthora rubi TaxID=129364 RepID=A0A6A3L4L7_9STRA|nr:hypothetical protein PR002_g32976 [Phytophthora rubi]KAE9012858.1 hypothetical protein PR001_g15561 [Phytophthora rubi]KAE9278357.1 hypothetical protein PR003_g28548 [Phytophthora rubi]
MCFVWTSLLSVILRSYSMFHSKLGNLVPLGARNGGLHRGCDGGNLSGLLRYHSG